MTINSSLSVQEQPAEKIAQFSPFTGSGRRLDGKSSAQPTALPSSPLAHQANANIGVNGSKLSSASSRRQSGKLVFGANANPSSNGTPKVLLLCLSSLHFLCKQKPIVIDLAFVIQVPAKSSSKELPQDEEKSKFQAFTGKKYSLRG